VIEKFRAAHALYLQDRLVDAGKLCQEVVDLQPAHFEALHLLGVIAFRSGQMTDAIVLLARAIAAKPGSAEAYNSLGDVLARLGRPEQALLGYAQAITLKPDFAEARANHSDMVRELEAVAASPGAAVASDATATHCCSCFVTIGAGPDRCPRCTAGGLRCVDPEDDPVADDARFRI
jgi:tetratricopeptide (TPR) repeat protein